MKKNRHWVYKIYPQKIIQKIESKIKLLGSNCKHDPIYFLNVRLLLCVTIFVLFLIFSKHGYFLAPLFTIICYLACERIYLDYPIKKRIKTLENDAAFFFEVLSLTLDSGRNIKSALEITTQNIDNELADEFQKTLAEVKLGKSFTESLNDMKERIPSDTINNIILSLTQSSVFGTSIMESLTNQLDYLHEKKLLDIKGEMTKLPTKISVVSVLFFIPIMLLIILSPVLINFLTR